MNLKNIRLFYFSLVAFIIFATFSQPIIELFPQPKNEPFFSLGLLGKEGLAEQYYPGTEPIIYFESPVSWKIYLYNHMGEAQQIKIKIKLMESNTPSPNTTTCTPSPTTEIYEIRNILQNNETMIIPYEWTIREAIEINNSHPSLFMDINEDTINIDLDLDTEKTLKMVFELWVYDTDIDNFVFGWSVRGETHCAWNHIYFDLLS
ncbi:MAG: hypothetical protein ACXACP_05685 [Candidatus Hodarchaeales archaeon]